MEPNPFGLPTPLLALLQRRGFDTAEAIAELLDPHVHVGELLIVAEGDIGSSSKCQGR
jgi:hypothetical protein